LVLDVGDDPSDESCFEVDADGAGGGGDGLGEAVTGGGPHGDHTLAQHFGELAILEGAVEEVGPHRQDDADPAALIRGHGGEVLQEQSPGGLGANRREELLELVDDDEEG
jgi:hypothetical protein